MSEGWFTDLTKDVWKESFLGEFLNNYAYVTFLVSLLDVIKQNDCFLSSLRFLEGIFDVKCENNCIMFCCDY